MIKLAKIVQIDTNRVTLRLEEKVQCTDCKSRCSDGFLSFLFRNNNQGILSVGLTQKEMLASHLQDDHKFFQVQHKENDVVGLNFNDSEIFKMAFVLYGLPILIFVAMLFIGYYLFQQYNLNTDLGGIIGLVSGLFLSKFIIHYLQIKLKPKVKFFK